LIDYLLGVLGRGQVALVYVYCDYRDKAKQDICTIIGELAKQLLLQSSSIPDEVWALFQKHTKITTDRAQQIFSMLARRFESTVVCIDALDECEPQARSKLLQFLRKEGSLHVFCTGRTSVETEAIEQLGPLGTQIKQIFAHEEDLRRHIEAEIAQDRRKKAMDEQLQEEITEALLSRSQKL
jgi:hypothetical protein